MGGRHSGLGHVAARLCFEPYAFVTEYVALNLSIDNLKTLETVTVKSQTTASEVLSQGAGALILLSSLTSP